MGVLVSIQQEPAVDGYLRGQTWNRVSKDANPIRYDLIRARGLATSQIYYLLPPTVANPSGAVNLGPLTTSNYFGQDQLQAGFAIERTYATDPDRIQLLNLIAEYPPNAVRRATSALGISLSGQFASGSFIWGVPFYEVAIGSTNWAEAQPPSWSRLFLDAANWLCPIAAGAGTYQYSYWANSPSPSPGTPIAWVLRKIKKRVTLVPGQPFTLKCAGALAHTLKLHPVLAGQAYDPLFYQGIPVIPQDITSTTRSYADQLAQLFSLPQYVAANLATAAQSGPWYTTEDATTENHSSYGLLQSNVRAWTNLTSIIPEIGPWP
jgi:hypothetical protein